MSRVDVAEYAADRSRLFHDGSARFRRYINPSDKWSFKRAQYEKVPDRFPPDSCRVDRFGRLQKRIRQLFLQKRFPRPHERDRGNLRRRNLSGRLRRNRDDANERRQLRLRSVRAERLLAVRSVRFRSRRLRRLSRGRLPGHSMSFRE